MIDVIIFSYNRASQLNTLLKSIDKFKNSIVLNISVIYNTSDSNYEDGYQKLVATNTHVNFIKEKTTYKIQPLIWGTRNFIRWLKYNKFRTNKNNFRKSLIDALSISKNKLIMFLTDDSCFISEIDIRIEILNIILSCPETSYSLRTNQEIIKRENSKVQKSNIKEAIKWNFSEHDFSSNTGYPFSVDAHIYNKEKLIKEIKNTFFVNPNTFESFIASDFRRKKKFDICYCNKTSCIKSYPINIVQDVYENESLSIDCEKINKLFLDGWELIYPNDSLTQEFQQYPTRVFFQKKNNIKEISTR